MIKYELFIFNDYIKNKYKSDKGIIIVRRIIGRIPM